MKVVLAALAALALAPAASAAPLVVRTSLDPRTVLFGEPAVAEVTVVADPALVDASTVRIQSSVAPFRRIGPVTSELREVDGAVTVTRRVRIACVSDACRARDALRPVQLRPVRVTARGTNGRQVAAHATWPTLLVAPRVPADAAAGEPEWRVDTRPPAPSYRIRPGLASTLLLGAAGLLAAVAVALVTSELLRRRRRVGAERLSELEAALAAVRASTGAPAPQRRRAAGMLARALERRRDARAGSAGTLAWDEPEPEPERMTALADELEREVRA